MQKQILEELKDIKRAIATIAGTSNLPPQEQLSKTVLDKAAKEFQKLTSMNDQWVNENDLYKYFKGCYHNTGKFIREEFGFSNYFKQSYTYYYNKAAIQDLAKELKARNINLKRYKDLKEDQENFKKKIAAAAMNKKASKGKKDYHLPDYLQDIMTSEYPKPSIEVVKEDLKNIQEEFFTYKLADYIDIYSGNHAMVKYEYHYEKYISNEIKLRCKRWCERFNYANNALELLSKKKANFIPVKEDDMFEL
ncbi:MAG: hypothetical protein P0Y49_04830 [Candidatus Pedobacter colombiensis]|uniref:Uncharacterized protein n=1 Tax=Candidatus Pedobacter colombiensis TaxID=3121371 RepID=A0AAJ6B8F6_9SPHI|nr:hypothetical protein [Pedobacter sp.]WEK20461.1 MAG: hypothetical protein P0Y49_04830 [Pedobacter sp.]